MTHSGEILHGDTRIPQQTNQDVFELVAKWQSTNVVHFCFLSPFFIQGYSGFYSTPGTPFKMYDFVLRVEILRRSVTTGAGALIQRLALGRSVITRSGAAASWAVVAQRDGVWLSVKLWGRKPRGG